MDLSQNGIDLIKSFEGCKLTAYKDVVGVLTIGYGHIKNVESGQVITQVKAEQLLKEDCKRFIDHVNTYQSKYNWNQNQFDALVSFAFNIGSITQLTANGTRNNEIIANKMLEYYKAGGKTINGLLTRRKKEQALFLTLINDESNKDEDSTNPYTKSITTIRKGNKGESVKWLQWELINDGYDIVLDGIFGNATYLAVKQFQKNNGLIIDGIVGIKTITALNLK